ncbi:hypothetical protein [Pseudokineococcus sp. 1T1Z-3]|uniref:hypothetical protein n=1 Tax=Pseudokineococcus sp. 1T1Z-3 TaxID=3132745 RepID=UPI0030A27B12
MGEGPASRRPSSATPVGGAGELERSLWRVFWWLVLLLVLAMVVGFLWSTRDVEPAPADVGAWTAGPGAPPPEPVA